MNNAAPRALLIFAMFAAGISEAKDPPTRTRAPKTARPLIRNTFAMEAYFSWDGQRIIFQGRNMGKRAPLQVYVCDYRPNQTTEANPIRLTEGLASHECTFFSRDGQYIVYATSETEPSEENTKDFGGYPYFYDLTKEIWVAKLDGDSITNKRRVTHNKAYEAETSYSPLIKGLPARPDGIYILYTSSRSGNLDLWIQRVFDEHGKEVSDTAIQLTDTPTSQEGGAFFLSDHEVVYRTWEYDSANPMTEQFERNRVNFRTMHIHTLDLATGDDTTYTSGNARHWAPFPHPGGRKVVFAKRDFAKPDHNFDIYVLDLDTREQQPIVTDPGFDGYAVFHPSGKTIMYSRFDAVTHDFSLWTVPYPPPSKR